jgi:periplasmic protein TonB
MAYSDQRHSSRHVVSIVGVAAVHAAIGYAFISGLAMEVLTRVPTILQVIDIPVDAPPPSLPEAPPPEKAVERVTTPEKVVVMASDANQNVVPKVLDIFPTSETPKIELTPPPPVPSLASRPRVKGSRSQWITTDDYPASSLRNNEAGSVAISVTVGADGRVAACEVAVPSGYPALDAATCRLYTRRARFDPAKDASGAAVPATYADRVRWQLPPE